MVANPARLKRVHVAEVGFVMPTSAAAEQSRAHTTTRALLFKRCTR